MKYMGSKSRVAKPISAILNRCIYNNNIHTYIEPFVGGANMIDHVICDIRKGSDLNPYLIALFQHLQSGGELLEEVPRSLYSEVREKYKSGVYENWYVGNVGFLASFNGRWFDGGYAQTGIEHTKRGDRVRNYYQESKANLLAQMPSISDVLFSVCDYRELELPAEQCVIYCDPPYSNTKQYANALGFDYAEFWEIMREWSKKHYVFISEENAPEDFKGVWAQVVTRSIKATDKSRSTELLVSYEQGKYFAEGGVACD